VSCSHVEQLAPKPGRFVEELPELQHGTSELRVGLCGGLNNSVVLLVNGVFGRPVGGSAAPRTELGGRFEGLATVTTRLRLRRAGVVVRFLDVSGFDPDLLVPLPVGRVVVGLEHPVVFPAGDVCDLLGLESLSGQAGDSGVSEVVRIHRLLDVGAVGADLEHAAQRVGTEGTLLWVVVVVVPEDRPEGGFVSRVGMVLVEPGTEFGTALEDRVPLVRRALVTGPVRVRSEVGSFGVEVVDVLDSKLKSQGRTSATVDQELDERRVPVVLGVLFQRFDVLGLEDLVFVDAADTLGGRVNFLVEAEVSVVGFVVEPLEEDLNSRLVPSHAAAVGFEAVPALFFRLGEGSNEITVIGSIHLDEGDRGSLGAISETTEVPIQRVERDVLVTLSFHTNEVVDRFSVGSVDIALLKQFPLPIELILCIAGVIDVHRILPNLAHILRHFGLTSAVYSSTATVTGFRHNIRGDCEICALYVARTQRTIINQGFQQSRFRLLVVTDALDNFCEGDIFAYIGNLDSNTLGLFSVGNNNDEPALNTRDTVALIADIFDFDGALFAFLDRGRLWRLLWLRGSVSVVCLVGRGCR
jgi:hypothetical protein